MQEVWVDVHLDEGIKRQFTAGKAVKASDDQV